MKLAFLPYVREGLVPTTTTASRGQVPVTLTLESPQHAGRDVTRVLSLLGPGDVITIEPRQVLRVTPAAGTRNAEPEFFPSIEFDAPDLPWAYSPVIPDLRRVMPWLALVVVDADSGAVLAPGQQGQSPQVLHLTPDAARRELPVLTEAWGWAHAQVACETTDRIAETLAQHPDRTLSRLLSPRRLLPFHAYHACVVPTFLSGRLAGLGTNPVGDRRIVTGLEPAWSTTDVMTELPVYFSWSFRTGEAGDFESLAQRLRATPLDASAAPTAMRLALPGGDGQMTVDWEPPLRVKGQTPSRDPRPAAALAQITEVLRPPTGTQHILGPAYFGAPWIDDRSLDLTTWSGELNLTPAMRAAAGLGAEAVRGEQESLVDAAEEQLERFRTRQREGRRKQLATVFVNRVKLRLSNAPVLESARVFAPLAVASQTAASDVGLFTAAGRRLMRKVAATRLSAGPVRPTSRPVIVSILERDLPVLEATDMTSAILLPSIVDRVPVAPVPPPITPVAASSIPTGAFSPVFPRPMSELLSERCAELMLPAGGAIPQDGALLVESNSTFIEAFLVGANQEINYELLWRGWPSDARATPFRRFWASANGADDIEDIRTWNTSTPLGTHTKTGDAMVLLVRSELVRRYPSLVVAAVPGTWNADGSRQPVKDASMVVLPAFRGRVGADIIYAGFSRPSQEQVIGDRTPSGSPGWFFLLSENPGDPRFGLDRSGGTTPATRATLSWAQLSLPPEAPYATVSSLPAVPDARFTAADANAASVANLTRQRPFRAYLHGSLLVRAEA